MCVQLFVCNIICLLQCSNVINIRRQAKYGDGKFVALEQKYGNTSKFNGFLMFLVYLCDEEGPTIEV